MSDAGDYAAKLGLVRLRDCIHIESSHRWVRPESVAQVKECAAVSLVRIHGDSDEFICPMPVAEVLRRLAAGVAK